MKHTNDQMYTGTPCDKCGGGTLLLSGGSIWCSAEDPHPGGHFVKRVAFERPPNRDAKPREWSKQPASRTKAPAERRASTPTSKPVKVPGRHPLLGPDEDWGPSVHDFVETKS